MGQRKRKPRADGNGRLAGGSRLIDKQDAAREQLIAAVELQLSGRHALAAHVLTCSAARILFDLYKHEGVVGVVERSARALAVSGVDPKRFLTAQRMLYNFAKHADKDHLDRMEHNVEHTDYLLWGAIFDYMNMFGGVADELFAFMVWFVWVYPKSFLRRHPAKPIVARVFPKRVPKRRERRLFWARKLLDMVRQKDFSEFYVDNIPLHLRPSLAELRKFP